MQSMVKEIKLRSEKTSFLRETPRSMVVESPQKLKAQNTANLSMRSKNFIEDRQSLKSQEAPIQMKN